MNALLVISHIVFLGTTVVSGLPKNLGRITGGKNAKIGEAPYIVAFSKETIFCAGTIIHANWVLTSAQCLINEGFLVIAGLHKADSKNGAWTVQKRIVPDVSYHVRHDYFYDSNFDGFDAGLVFISEPFELGKDLNVEAAGLPTNVFDYVAVGGARLYGYGYTSHGIFPEELQVLETKVLSPLECQEQLANDGHMMSYNICTDGPEGICLFDAGAPLVRDTNNGVELIGIASWGESPCDTRNSPSVFTRVDLLKEWINKTISSYKHLEKCKF